MQELRDLVDYLTCSGPCQTSTVCERFSATLANCLQFDQVSRMSSRVGWQCRRMDGDYGNWHFYEPVLKDRSLHNF
ncbi:Chitooligosaccharide deacetylase [Frankliniella fusca]|uniref:Chitooligosaccharide deacetylase n=1 Tax=Frankliniella fusca TaxID=407009 RepID=A0AAE1H8T6_9NEOP|nr:Chitooligosaccharide deacetylase [Frankliniella fusca]